jgi:hypothetical protein
MVVALGHTKPESRHVGGRVVNLLTAFDNDSATGGRLGSSRLTFNGLS